MSAPAGAQQVVPGVLSPDNPAADSCDDPTTTFACSAHPDLQCGDEADCPAGDTCEPVVEECLVIEGRKQRPGDVTVELNFRAPPVQAQIDQAHEQLRRANQVLCDATDGYFRIARVRYSLGNAARERSEIWWHPQPGRAFATGLEFLSDATHISVFDYNWGAATRGTSMRGDILAHELGHSLLGFDDMYSEPTAFRAVAFDGPPLFAGRPVGNQGVDYSVRQFVDANSERRHSIMQQANGQVCSDVNAATPLQTDPLNWSNIACLSDLDCQAAGIPPGWVVPDTGGFGTCPAIPSLMSELSSQASGFDLNRGSGQPCPDPLPGLQLVIPGYLRTATSCGVDADADGNVLDPGEECEAGVAPTAACDVGAGTMSCNGCRWDRSACVVPAGSEECAAAAMPPDATACEGIGLGDGVANCNANGTWNRLGCNLPFDERVASTFGAPGAPGLDGALWFSVDVRDSSSDEATAYHTLDVHILQQPTGFTIQIAADEGDFLVGGMPGTQGSYHRLAVWDVRWDAATGQVDTIDGQPYDPAAPPVLVLGSDSDVASYMTNSNAGGRKDALPTGVFANGAPAQQVTLQLEDLLNDTYTEVDGSAGWTRYSPYVRHGVVAAGARAGQIIPQRPTSTDPFYCGFSYNPETQRFELSPDGLRAYWVERARRVACQADPACMDNDDVAGLDANPFDALQPEWDRLVIWADERFDLTIDNPPNEPDPDVDPALCPDPDLPTTLSVSDPVEIVLALDRSGSMGEAYGNSDRLDYAKAAARALLQFYAGGVTSLPVNVGVVWYNHDADVVEPVGGGAGNLRTLVPGTAVNPNEIGADDLAAQLVDSSDPGGAVPEASGFTAIGEALLAAQGLFTPASPGNLKSIILLTDGEETVHNNTGTPEDPEVALRTVEADPNNIEVYTVPTGGNADRQLLQKVADATKGKLLDARDPAELPAMFFEAAVRQQGQALARHHNSEVEAIHLGDGYYEFRHSVQVEPDANELALLISARKLAGYSSLGFELRDPSGTPVTVPSPGVSLLSDQYFYLLRVAEPDSGEWTFSVYQVPDDGRPSALVSAFVDNPDHTCFVGVSKRFVGPGEPVFIHATAIDQLAIDQGVNMSVRVRRPDHSEVTLDLEQDPILGGEHRGTFLASQFRGRGLYEVVARCEVQPGATLREGEPLVDDAPANQGPVTPFVREVSTSFYMNLPDLPPLPGPDSPLHGDADGDCIPDGSEDPGDYDNDGLPGPYDADNDADDVPDCIDPDPTDPNVPYVTRLVADAGPDQIVECVGNGTAGATLDGSASVGPSGTLAYSWSAPVALSGADTAIASGDFPVGTTTVTLTVSQGGASDEDTALVTVLDTTGPQLVVPPDFHAQTCGSLNIGVATATDSCGGPVQVVSDQPASFKAGVNIVTWTAIDQYGNETHGTQRVVVGANDDPNCCPAGSNVIIGTSNNDVLTGTAGVDCIFGLGAQDTIYGLGGNDVLSGGDGDDIIEGGDGDDVLQGGHAKDVLRGQGGSDFIFGNDGDDSCWGGLGDDLIYGGQGQDKLYGEGGADQLFGEDGDDRLEGGDGDDLLVGGGLHDTCLGGPGTNTLQSCETVQ